MNLQKPDIISSFAGIRPIVRGDTNARARNRAHVVWDEHGLITIAGGKLTIFRVMAEDTLKLVAGQLGRPLPPIKVVSASQSRSRNNRG